MAREALADGLQDLGEGLDVVCLRQMQHGGRFGRGGDAQQAQASKDKERDPAHRSALYLLSHERDVNAELRLRSRMAIQNIENIVDCGLDGLLQLSTRPSRVVPFPYGVSVVNGGVEVYCPGCLTP
jgi:hypothetical protein